MEPQNFNVDGSDLNFPQINLIQDVASSSSQPPPPVPDEIPATATVTETETATATETETETGTETETETETATVTETETATDQQASSSSAPPSAAPARVPEHLMHKNRLQEFAQKSNIALPLYQTVNEGSAHAPRFRSTVLVDGVSYTSQMTFSQRKAAEQNVAGIAMESLSKNVQDEGCPFVSENMMFSKSILNEYATKLDVEKPTYSTEKLEGLLPLFVSSLMFNGTKYSSEAARSKKEAEQLAARAAILSILAGDSSSGALYEIVKSKSKICAAAKLNKPQCIDAGTVSTKANTGHTSVSLDQKFKEGAGIVAARSNETSCQEFQMPDHAPSTEPTKLPDVSLQPGSAQPTGESSSSKKRRKNKKKANKKSRLESPLPVAAFPLNGTPPCSVAQ